MKYPYQDASLSVEQRIEDLLSRMTLEEKFSQMRLFYPTAEQTKQVPFDLSILEDNRHRLGAIFNTSSMSEQTIRDIQDWAKNNTRLGIPIAIHGESLHGVMHSNATCFPQSLGLGATFNPELIEKIATQIGKEARANGITMTYAPNLDLSRDPRWGRVEENYGEDPYLTSMLGLAYVKGLQSQGVAACPKHYIAHGSPEGGLNIAPVHIGEREFREIMMVPFKKVITQGNPKAIMPAYSEWDGVPIHASRYLLTDLLRQEFGFAGMVISDYSGIDMLCRLHHIAETPTDAGKLALYAGVDVEAPNDKCFNSQLEQVVRDGEIPMDWVDLAVSRVLRYKFEMGLFENPYANTQAIAENRNDFALKLACQAAEESIVLLKNENNLLPLSNTVKKVALIGPNADSPQLGDYSVPQAIEHTVTLRQALEERLGKDSVLFARGCNTASGSDQQFEEAVCAAKNADVVVIVLGDNSNFFGGIGWGATETNGKVAVTCGEGFDMHSLDLPGRQQQLLEAVYATGKPVVLVLETGRPYSICWAKEHIPAILQAWYPGEQGGYALTNILFGESDPSGRLPISFPRSAGHIPCYYNHKVSARGYYKISGSKHNPGRDYVFDTPEALFEFGAGMSYATFEYSNLRVPPKAKIGQSVQVSVTVKNTSARFGCEVLQLYVTDCVCRITPFVKQLRGIQKIWLRPGEKKTVKFCLGFEDFAFINEKMQQEVEAGEFIIRLGNLQAYMQMER